MIQKIFLNGEMIQNPRSMFINSNEVDFDEHERWLSIIISSPFKKYI